VCIATCATCATCAAALRPAAIATARRAARPATATAQPVAASAFEARDFATRQPPDRALIATGDPFVADRDAFVSLGDAFIADRNSLVAPGRDAVIRHRHATSEHSKQDREGNKLAHVRDLLRWR
jgi:hypothetical protein